MPPIALLYVDSTKLKPREGRYFGGSGRKWKANFSVQNAGSSEERIARRD
jgi:hypothetical protein